MIGVFFFLDVLWGWLSLPVEIILMSCKMVTFVLFCSSCFILFLNIESLFVYVNQIMVRKSCVEALPWSFSSFLLQLVVFFRVLMIVFIICLLTVLNKVIYSIGSSLKFVALPLFFYELVVDISRLEMFLWSWIC